MTKNIFILIAGFSLTILLSSYAQQACTPDPAYTNPSTQNGIYPDIITNFDTAYVGVPYSQLITIVIPPDTTVFFPIPWDSTVLTGASGLPASLSYACWNQNGFGNPNRCSWKGNSIGCAIITGTPTVNETGTHTLQFFTDNYLGGSTSANPYTITGYRIVVVNTLSVSENPKIQSLLQNNPNPFSDKTEIQFMAEENGTAEFKIYNMIGTIVQQEKVKVKKGQNKMELNASDFEPGIYFYSLVHGNQIFTRKMVVSPK